MLNRAAVLIGVRSAGSLPTLQAVFQGVAKMERWARDQSIAQDSIKILTDESATVSAPDILRVVTELVDRLNVEQLIIYFTGHGLNLGQSEYWLLSGFPNDPTAVVNVSASIERARICTVPYVVFISDACRTTAAGLRDQLSLMATLPIFPNTASPGRFKSVDVFYATTLGRPALEVQDPSNPTGGFQAIYTEAIFDALHAVPPMVAETDLTNGQHVIRSWPLKRHLENEVPLRLVKINPRNPPNQQPDAVISSDPTFWVSTVNTSASVPPTVRQPPPLPPDASKVDLANMHNFSLRALRTALDPQAGDVRAAMTSAKIAAQTPAESDAMRSFESIATTTATPFGPMHFETKCGFKVRGATIKEAFSRHAAIEARDDAGEACRIELKDGRRFANVLLMLQTGSCVILPAIAEFVTGLTFDDGELVDVTYEPSENSPRWQTFLAHRTKLRRLRAIIAASIRMGTFQLEGENDAASIARDMQVEKGIDPSMGIYAAYAYRWQGNQKRLEEMFDFMGSDLGMVFFDIAILAGKLPQNRTNAWPAILPPLPLLTQGWPLLDAFEIKLPARLERIRQHIDFNSLWTLYTAAGGELLREFFR